MNDVARERLAAGVDLFLECSPAHEGCEVPAWVRLRLHRELFQRLVRVRSECSELDIEFAEITGASAQFAESVNLVRGWSLRVDAHGFWVFGIAGYDGVVHSCKASLQALRAALRAPTSEPGADGAMWYGGALLLIDAFTDPRDFTGLLVARFPHLAARERDLQVTDLIAGHRAEASAGPTQPHRRRTSPF